MCERCQKVGRIMSLYARWKGFASGYLSDQCRCLPLWLWALTDRQFGTSRQWRLSNLRSLLRQWRFWEVWRTIAATSFCQWRLCRSWDQRSLVARLYAWARSSPFRVRWLHWWRTWYWRNSDSSWTLPHPRPKLKSLTPSWTESQGWWMSFSNSWRSSKCETSDLQVDERRWNLVGQSNPEGYLAPNPRFILVALLSQCPKLGR